MCGICGTAGFGSSELIRAMAGRLVHRGPDDEGYFDQNEPPLHLGNRRLSIIDVEGGRQPVRSEDGQVVAVQNGEIYNFRELRAKLESRGHRFRSQTDSEVIPHLYEEHGDAFAAHLDGMFAIALFDRRAQRLLLVRDHTGIKPLYLWERPGQLAFASEVKGFLDLPGFEPGLDREALHFLLNLRFVPGPRSLFRGVRKLAPGSILTWESGQTQERRYWTLNVEPDSGLRSAEDCVSETRRLLARAVDKQLVSDVPLGLYLSGGIDSSSLVAMAARNHRTVSTFSLGFDEPTDELRDARRVAQSFGTDHHETTIQMNALDTFPLVTWHVEEPKENAIQLHLLSRFASDHVKVALSGLGGDEIFGGYRIFDFLRRIEPAHRLVGPAAAGLLWRARGLTASVLALLGSMKLDLARRAIDFVLSAGAPARSYLLLRNLWEHDRRLFRAIYTPEAALGLQGTVESFFTPLFEQGSIREAALRAELSYKMADDFLMNEDRTSMANSLEVRVPFLDRELLEFAFSIPTSVKFAGGGLKVVLKRAMEGVLPAETLRKPKWGFTFDAYLQFQKDLRELASRELTAEFLTRQGIFQPRFVHGIIDHPPHRWMRWHYFLLWLILGVKVWEDLFVRRLPPEECYGRID